MLIEKLIDIIANYLDIEYDDLTEDTSLLYEFDLDEDQLEELADIITDEIGKYISPNMIEESNTIAQLAEEIEEL